MARLTAEGQLGRDTQLIQHQADIAIAVGINTNTYLILDLIGISYLSGISSIT